MMAGTIDEAEVMRPECYQRTAEDNVVRLLQPGFGVDVRILRILSISPETAFARLPPLIDRAVFS